MVSRERMPNYIALKEPRTRPDVLHLFCTVEDSRMLTIRGALIEAFKVEFPEILTVPEDLIDAYDMLEIRQAALRLIKQYPADTWCLNATCGTKLMSAALISLFMEKGLEVYYVDTSGNSIRTLQPNWDSANSKFESGISATAFLRLFGIAAQTGSATDKENHELVQLKTMDWEVFPNQKCYLDTKQPIMEFDAICIDGYTVYAIEFKSRSAKRNQPQREFEHVITRDINRLQSFKNGLGGPFARCFWVLSGQADLSEAVRQRMQLLGVEAIIGLQSGTLRQELAKLGVPAALRWQNDANATDKRKK